MLPVRINAQGFLHADGKQIADGRGENFIIRGIGTGNWMIQEGYMMKTSGVADTQHEFRKKLEQTIGTALADSFYSHWLHDHFRKADVDSLAAWGFNTVRVAMHYKWFTPPIEDEPVPGEVTWLNTGFDMVDSLLSWCSSNHIYLILDMHGAPGGQGSNASISDYDKSKPSLWESGYNKTKLTALWYKLAERYRNEPWIGGYDLINETNWTFPEGNNSQLRNIFERITDTIRLVDQNHIIFIEGNWWANDFSGLTPPWDNNLVYSFHKYWSYNNDHSLDWVISLRDRYNVPLWLGETGENSNTWFTNLVKLAEEKNIGWSWWPVKKGGINNPLKVTVNNDYIHLVNYWKGQAQSPGVEEAYQAVLTFSRNHRLENCTIQYDVLDALFRQPFSTALKPYKIYKPGEYIHAVDYAMGRNGYAYFDVDTGDYHSDTDQYTNWNQGGQLRNDGVDIQKCSDTDQSNGYNVGWTEDGEWMTYNLHCDSSAVYDCIIRSASASVSSYIRFEANGHVISNDIYLPPTGNWTSWRSTTSGNIILPAGDVHVKLKIINGGANINYFRFTNARSVNSYTFSSLSCETAAIENEIYVHMNKPITGTMLNPGDWQLYADNQPVDVTSIVLDDENSYKVILTPGDILSNRQEITLSYSGNSVESNGTRLETFNQKAVRNNLADFFTLPCKIEAEAFLSNNGLALEDCTDEGGGLNTAYANPGDYLDYLVYVPVGGTYKADFRIATEYENASLQVLVENHGSFSEMKSFSLPVSGSWQNWLTQSTSINLPEGKYRLRVQTVQGEHNLNWFDFTLINGISEKTATGNSKIYPNPADDLLTIEFNNGSTGRKRIELFDISGKLMMTGQSDTNSICLKTSGLKTGSYFLTIYDSQSITTHKLLIN